MAQRSLTIVAQDPSVRVTGRIVRARVRIPFEELEPGPRGERVRVVDYDSSTRTLYSPAVLSSHADPFENASDDELLGNPQFHGVNVYAIIMGTLQQFELGLGRRVEWSFPGHQLYVAPHAFAEANAFYSRKNRALLFGYCPRLSGKGIVLTCLAHDIIAHETAHALLDGLRETFVTTLSPQQTAFHEAFADIVALLSICSTRGALDAAVADIVGEVEVKRRRLLHRSSLTVHALQRSLLFGVGRELAAELSGVHGSALRRSVELMPRIRPLHSPEFQEPHRLGEILVAAVVNAFLAAWVERLNSRDPRQAVDRERFTEQGAEIATGLLTMCIRALDYCPPAALDFGDFLSALLTAHYEWDPVDDYHLRPQLRGSFASYGVKPYSKGLREPGVWDPPGDIPITYDDFNVNFIRSDPVEVFRFVWGNRRALKLHTDADTQILSVRTSSKQAPNAVYPREETAVEYLQTVAMRAGDLTRYGIRKPSGMPSDTVVTLYGGSTLIFNQRGVLRYDIGHSVMNPERQSDQLAYAWEFAGSGHTTAMSRSRVRAWPFEPVMKRPSPRSRTGEKRRS